MKPRLLDLFCGAGGCSVGYARAGFDVVGVDIVPQPNYPFEFTQMDALEYLSDPSVLLFQFDAIHASPPCQAYSVATTRWPGRNADHADLVEPTRELLAATGLPYVIENVPGAPLLNPAQLCGSWFGLDLARHRIFETNWPLMSTPCSHHWQTPRFKTYDERRGESLARVVPVYGQGRRVRSASGQTLDADGDRQLREAAMGIDWMTDLELAQAIPPAYTELIGAQLLQHVRELEKDRGQTFTLPR